jgi:hypothetical protein
MMLPLCASVLLSLRRRWFWSGALLAAAFAFRQSAAVNVIVIALAIFWLEESPSRLKALLSVAAGGIAGLIVTAGLIALTGSLSGFCRWTIGTLVGYASNSWSRASYWPARGTACCRSSSTTPCLDRGRRDGDALALGIRRRPAGRGLARGRHGGLAAGGHLSWHYFIRHRDRSQCWRVSPSIAFGYRGSSPQPPSPGSRSPRSRGGAFDVTADPLTYDFSPPVPQHEAVSRLHRRAHVIDRPRVHLGRLARRLRGVRSVMATRFLGFCGVRRGSESTPNNWDVAPTSGASCASTRGSSTRLIADTAPRTGAISRLSDVGLPGPRRDRGARLSRRSMLVGGVVIYARNP